MFLLRFILILLLLYFVFNFVSRLLFPTARQRNHSYSRYSGNGTGNQREGEVSINTGSSHHKKKFDKSDGEYVSYEEVKDDK